MNLAQLLADEVEETVEEDESFWDIIVNFFTGSVWRIILFFVVLVVGIIVVRLLIRLSKYLINRSKMERVTGSFVLAVVKFVLWLLLVIVLLVIMGVNFTALIAVVSAIAVAVVLALEDCIAAVADGLIIVSSHIFKEGDYIDINGMAGRVININFLFTTINTLDNVKITIPNTQVVGNTVKNHSADGTRRIDFTFSVAYDSDVEKVKKIVTNVMKSNGCVYVEPENKAPFCRLKTINSSSLDFFAYCWVDGKDYFDVFYYVMENVYNEFKRHGIVVPYPQIEMRERTDEVVMPVTGRGLPRRVEKVRVEPEKRFNIEDQIIDLTVKGIEEVDKAVKESNRRLRRKKKGQPPAEEPAPVAGSETAFNADEVEYFDSLEYSVGPRLPQSDGREKKPAEKPSDGADAGSGNPGKGADGAKKR